MSKRHIWKGLLLASLGGIFPLRASAQPDSAGQLRASVLYGGNLRAHPALKRSVPIAFGLSALVPGLGQAYNRQWFRAAAGLGIELAVLTAYTSWRGQGVRRRDEYQVMAHESWSPLRYARWLNDYVLYLNGLPGGRTVSASPIVFDTGVQAIDFSNPGAWSEADRLLVRGLILHIRAVEADVHHPETGASFSHKLPFFGDQQYYELVGKYFQFAPGWQDYAYEIRDGVPTWTDSQGNFLASIDPQQTAADGTKPNVSPTFHRYAEKHGSANTYLRRASRISILFFVNHLFAAAEAAVSARLHNNRLRTRLILVPGISGNVWGSVTLRI